MSLTSELDAFTEKHSCPKTTAALIREVPTVRRRLEREHDVLMAAKADREARRASKPWTELDDRKVEADAIAGKPVYQTALALERTVNAVQVRRSKLGLTNLGKEGQ